VSKGSAAGAGGASRTGVAVSGCAGVGEARRGSLLVVRRESAGSGVDDTQGGVRGPSSSSASAAKPWLTLVPPPSMRSPTYEVMTMASGLMMPRSSTDPKSPK